MIDTPTPQFDSLKPHVSFIMPCYNEEAIINYTIPRLINAFNRAGYRIELVAVNNGSTDKTGELIQKLAVEYPSIVYHRVTKNQGYGYGILSGISLCTAPWVGIIPADGQVDAEDVVRLFDAVIAADSPVLGKVRRRFRMDGLRRKVVSVFYNFFFRALWPRLSSLDINGTPKILPRQILIAMNLRSTGWLLDPEMMIKAYYLGIRILEFNAFARMRGSGVSHVRTTTVFEFIRNLLAFRFSKEWQQDFDRLSKQAVQIKYTPFPGLSDSVVGIDQAVERTA